MNIKNSFSLTREKHLDHMVKVVPFIVFCYALQSFVILTVSATEFSSIGLTILGGFLAAMIAGFIFHDLNHQVIFSETHLKISFLFYKKEISYEDIWSIEIKDPGQAFSNLSVISSSGKNTMYFIDDAEKIKAWIESHKQAHLKAA